MMMMIAPNSLVRKKEGAQADLQRGWLLPVLFVGKQSERHDYEIEEI